MRVASIDKHIISTHGLNPHPNLVTTDHLPCSIGQNCTNCTINKKIRVNRIKLNLALDNERCSVPTAVKCAVSNCPPLASFVSRAHNCRASDYLSQKKSIALVDAVHAAGPPGSAVGIGPRPMRASPINARAAVLGGSQKALRNAGDAGIKAGIGAAGLDTRPQQLRGEAIQVCMRYAWNNQQRDHRNSTTRMTASHKNVVHALCQRLLGLGFAAGM